MPYIAALDYQHLDNGMFLTALARSISQQGATNPILVHADSAYTDRIVQTGVMREEAKIRSIKDLNHRLVALLADEGVSAIGINGYQRQLITQKKGRLSLDTNFFNRLPRGPLRLISTLVWDDDTASPVPVSLQRMVSFLRAELDIESVFAFSSNQKDEIIIHKKPDELHWNNLPAGFAKDNLPREFHQFNHPLYLATARNFSTRPIHNQTILIH